MTLLHCALLVASAVAPLVADGDGWLGVILADSEKPVIAEVIPDSPAEKAGLLPNDVLLSVDGQTMDGVEVFAATIRSRNAGDDVRLRIRRAGETRELTVILAIRPGAQPTSGAARPAAPLQNRKLERPEPRPAPAPGSAYLGIRVVEEDGGLTVTEVLPGGPAARSGVRVGGRLVRIGQHEVRGFRDIDAVLRGLSPGQSIGLAIRRGSRGASSVDERQVEVGVAPRAAVARPAPGPMESAPIPGRRSAENRSTVQSSKSRLSRLRTEIETLRREVAELTEQLEEEARRRRR